MRFPMRSRTIAHASHAVVAQLVERWLPKPKVAGSRPVYRSKKMKNFGVSENFLIFAIPNRIGA